MNTAVQNYTVQNSTCREVETKSVELAIFAAAQDGGRTSEANKKLDFHISLPVD